MHNGAQLQHYKDNNNNNTNNSPHPTDSTTDLSCMCSDTAELASELGGAAVATPVDDLNADDTDEEEEEEEAGDEEEDELIEETEESTSDDVEARGGGSGSEEDEDGVVDVDALAAEEAEEDESLRVAVELTDGGDVTDENGRNAHCERRQEGRRERLRGCRCGRTG